MTMPVRVALGITAIVASLVASAVPVGADELEDYLTDAEAAEYAGRRIVVTNWDGTSTVGVYEFVQGGGVAVIEDGSEAAMVGTGRMSSGSDGVILPKWSSAPLTDRYTTDDAVAVERLGREAHVITVREAEEVRATIVFDDATGAPLGTEVYDADGNLFRYTAMLDFDPSPVLVYSTLSGTGFDYDVMLPEASATLPADAGGYVRADAYVGPDDTTHTFYSDGLFSFSVFEISGEARLGRFEEATRLVVNSRSYALIVEPAEMWVSWTTPSMTYVLVGDLPPDHLEQVLRELPAPARRGILQRLWRGIFG